MSAIGQHLNFALINRAVISVDSPAHRRAARGVLAALEPFALLAFRIADTHVHLLLAEDATPAVEAARRAKIALHQALHPSAPFGPTHSEPVRSQAHAYRAFRYVLSQDAHHGFGHDPRAEASNLPDLLGLRALGARTRSEVRRRLPRLERGELLDLLGVDDLQPGPVALSELMEATLAATALPDLTTNRPEVVTARLAAAHAATEPATAVAEALTVTSRAVQRLRRRAPPTELVRAILLQADLHRRKPLDAILLAESTVEYHVA